MSAATGKSFGEKMGDWFRATFGCCAGYDDGDEEERPALQISGPTNFRREDISIPGLDPEQQRFIREKAISDASKMYVHLQSLRSSPSGQFADPKNTTTLPSYEDFVTPRPAPAPEPTTSDRRSSTAPRISLTLFSGRRPSASHAGRGLVDGVKAHGRKISETFVGKPLGFSAGGGGGLRKGEGNPYEMRSLMDSSRTAVAGADGKMSGESFSVAGSDEMVVGDRDSAKGGIGKL